MATQPQSATAGDRCGTLPSKFGISRKMKEKKQNKKVTDSPTQKSHHHSISRPTSAEAPNNSATDHVINIVFQKQVKINALTSSVEVSLGHSKKENLTHLITEILKELDFVLSFTQRAKSVKSADATRNEEIVFVKTKLEDCERELYYNLAGLVRWVDSPVAHQDRATNDEIKIQVQLFEKYLADIVHLMGEASERALSPPALNSHTLPPGYNFLLGDSGYHGSATLPSKHMSAPVEPLKKFSVPSRLSESIPSSPLRGPPQSSILCKPHRHMHSSSFDSAAEPIHEPLLTSSLPFNGSDNSAGSGSLEVASRPPPKPPRRAQSIEVLDSGVNGNRSGTGSPEVTGEEPPPLPMKKKNRRVTVGDSRGIVLEETTELGSTPPPLPVKQRRSLLNADLPSTPNWELPPEPTSQFQPPTPPDRLTSDPNFRTVMEYKELRVHGPLPLTRELIEKGGKVVETIQRYNKQLVECLEEGRPALPPKQKHVFAYQGLFKMDEYNFPDELYANKLILKTSECPPPIPVKKHRQSVKNSSASRSESVDSPPEEDTAPPDPCERTTSLATSRPSQRRESTGSLDEEDDNLLEIADVTAYLRFNKEDDGGYSLRGGPVDALIAYAASPLNIADRHYSEAFLLIYPTFVSHLDLINKLLHRLTHFYKESKQTNWSACASLLVRVLKHIKIALNQESEIKVINLVHMMITAGQLKFAQLLRDALIAKLKQLIPDNTAKIAPVAKLVLSGSKKHTLFDFKHETIARQLTLLDADYFYKLDISEMLCWAAEADEEKSPGLTKFTEHFNKVSQWTKTIILDRNLDKRGREKVMSFFLSIMKSLRQFNNFNAYLAILSAMESAPISRLEWPDRIIRSLEEPRALIDNKGSFKAYRDAFAAATPPCIPYIGLYLQDLTFINMVKDRLEDDKSCINFNKRWKQFNTVDKIRQAQTKQYTIDPDYPIMAFFGEFEEHLTDAELYHISLEIKPRGTATLATTTS